MVRAGIGVMVVTPALILEYESVCKRPEHRIHSGLSEAETDQFVDRVATIGTPVEIHFQWRPQLSDPYDEIVLEAAVNEQAQAIVTFNRRDYKRVRETFGIDVLLPREALERNRKT